jgi:glycosyltransferase involved in cell wall biosynthesis
MQDTRMMISVIVATHNRRDKLQMLMKSVEGLEIDEGLRCEFIIVDNNSTDDTKRVVDSHSERSRYEIRYVFERERGNGRARNRAIAVARGEVLAFTDDDCILDPQWIRRISRKFEVDPALACMGGRVELFDKNDRAMTIRTWNEEIEAKSAEQLYGLIIGCNMAVRRGVLDAIGAFDPVFGPGSEIGSGGDSEFLYRTYKKGLAIKYYPDVLVFHNHGRRTDDEARALGKRYARGRGGFYCKYILQGDRVILKMALQEMASVTKSLIKNLLRGKSTRPQWRSAWGLSWGVVRGLPIFLRRAVAPRD